MFFYKPTRSFLAAMATLFLLLFLAACQQVAFDLDPVPSLNEPETSPTAPENIESPESDQLSSEESGENAAEHESADSEATTDISPEAVAAEPTGRIAFINLQGQLSTINPDGSDERTLSEEGRFYQFPAWSPAGGQIATIGFSQDGAGVFVFEDDEEQEATPIYEDQSNSPIYLYWLPDGSQVSFIAPAGDSPGLALHLVPADGSDAGSVLATGQPFYWQWMRNNRQALIHVGTNRLSFLDLEGNESETGLGNNGFFQAPAISWTNRYFAYQQVSPDGRSLQIKDIIEDEVIHEQPHEGILTMAWNPQRLELVYVSPKESAGFIGPLIKYDVALDESKTLVPHNVLTFFWSPDGRYIAFLTPDELGRQTNNIAPSARRSRVTRQERRSLALGYVDVETGVVQYVADFSPTRLFIRQFIPFFDQYALSHRIWSPDSRFIVLPVIDEEEERPVIRVFATDGRQPVTITEGLSAFWSHQ